MRSEPKGRRFESCPRYQITSKNDLTADEVDTLNRLVVIFLEQAELRDKERRTLNIAHERYEVFDQKRRHAEAIAADADDVKILELLEKREKGQGGSQQRIKANKINSNKF